METKSQEELPIKDLLNVIIDKVKRV
jgi:hypothetical protein